MMIRTQVRHPDLGDGVILSRQNGPDYRQVLVQFTDQLRWVSLRDLVILE